MQTYQCIWIEETDEGYQPRIHHRNIDDLPEGDVLIQVAYSSLNFKDALSCSGNKGVTRNFPHQPGIDAAGVVTESSSDKFKAGDRVVVTGYDLGMNTAGGLAEYIRVPAKWLLPLPSQLNAKQAMQYGTAGLTAALCIQKLIKSGIEPSQGKIAVTGATGGVGALAIALLASMGFEPVAITGKASAHDHLKSIGAQEILTRESLDGVNPRPLLKPQYAGAIDVAGGNTLASLLKLIQPQGSVACCGLVDSPQLNTTVMPFILRGVSLLGVDSVEITLAQKAEAWSLIAEHFPEAATEDINRTVSLADVPELVQKMLGGKLDRHYVVEINPDL